MQKRMGLIIATCLATLSPQTHAIDVGASVTGGSDGLGVHLSVPVIDRVNARFGFNYFSFSFDGDTGDMRYDFKLKLNTFDALLDWFPFDGRFRLTGGLVYNANEITASAKPVGVNSYTVNGKTYRASDVGNIDSKISFNKLAPYLGIGFGNALQQPGRWTFTSDFGLLFQGSASASLKNSQCNLGASCAALANDLAIENQKLNDDLKGFQHYPIVRIGASYRF